MESVVDRVERQGSVTIVNPKEHKHTFIWLQGLGQPHQKYLNKLIEVMGEHKDKVKIVYPKAPDRYVTLMDKQTSSWFNVKFRGMESFTVPFDSAFSSDQVIDSFQNVLLPILEKESSLVKKHGGKLVVAGFSQGCGMAIHSLYCRPDLVDFAVGIAGYFFPITPYNPKIKDRLFVIQGLSDKTRPWEQTKLTYYGRFDEKEVIFIKGMEHNFTKQTGNAITSITNKLFGQKQV